MIDNDDQPGNRRRIAESQVDSDAESIENLSPEELKRRIHELKGYQIELEMQNEALRQTQLELSKVKDRYFDLYHDAAVGHVTVDSSGVVREVNASFATMLVLDPPNIRGHHLFQFIRKECQGEYLAWFKRLISGEKTDSPEVWLNPSDNSQVRVQLFGQRTAVQSSEDSNSSDTCEVMISGMNVTEKRRSQNELEETTTYLSRAIEIADLAWWHMNVSDSTVQFHPNKTDMLGYRFDDFIGKTYTVFTDLVHPDDYEAMMQNLRDHLEGRSEAYSIEYRIRAADGRYKWFMDFGKVSEKTPEGAPLGITGIVVDISERKQALIELQKSEANYRLLAEHTEDLVCLHDPDGTYIYVSPSINPMLGYSPDELIGRFPYDFFHPEDIERIANESHQATIEEKQKKSISYRFRNAEGDYIWIETHTIPVLSDDGTVTQLVTSSRDISERKQMVDTINEERLLLSSTFDAIRGGIVIIDKDLTIVQQNETMRQWAGKSLIGLHCRDAFPVCPGDCDSCRTESVLNRKKYSDQIFEYQSADGRIKTLHLHSYPLVKDDRVDGVVQFAEDITEVMSARIELERSEALSRLILNSTADAIFIIDRATMQFIDCNEMAYRSLGMTREELMQAEPHVIKPEYNLKSLTALFDEIINSPSQTGQIETRQRRIDGTMFPVEIFIGATRFENQVLLVASARDISDRLEANEALIKSEARYAIAQDVAGIGSWEWNLKTNAVFWSDEIYPLFGLEKMGGELTYESYLGLICEEDRQRTVDTVNQALDAGGDYEIEHRIIRPDGETRWLYGRGGLIQDSKGNPDRMVGIVQDVSGRKSAEQQMQLLSYVVEQSPAIIIVTDPQGSIQYVNSKFTLVTGYTPEEAIGKNPRILKSGNKSNDEYKEMWKTITSGREWHGEVYNKTKDGRFYWAQVSISSITDDQGEITHYIGIQEDISGRKGMERDLLRAKEEAEEANQAKSTFLASMSHELRTPLNSILGFAQILKSNRGKALTEKELGYASHILSSGKLLLELINDVLDLSKIESGRFDLAPESVALENAIIESIEQVESLAARHLVDVLYPRGENPFYAYVDERGMKQVIINILTNAIKYNRKGGEVRVSCQAGNKQFITVEISDTGHGISPEKVDELFQPFNRLGAETTNIEGTGIGLTITDRLVNMMGGKITVESTLGKGTTFFLEFPRSDAVAEERPSPVEDPQADDPLDHEEYAPERKSILYIEDNKTNLKLVESILGSIKNLDLESANEAESGIKAAKESVPDLILLDIHLPGMDGFSALQKLKQQPETSHIPVVAVTAKAMEGDAEKAIAAGFAEYVTKPIQVAAFKEIVRKILFEL